MNLSELKSQLKSNLFHKCYYLYGDDTYILHQAKIAIEKALGIEYAELNINPFFENIQVGQVVEAVLMLPFLSNYRLVKLKEFNPTAIDAKYFYESFLSQDIDSCICVIINTLKADNLQKYSKYYTSVDCNHPSLNDCALWIRRKIGQNNLEISDKNSYIIAEYTMCDMSIIAMQCEKLISYCAGSDKVSLNDIEKLVPQKSEYKIYEFTEAIAIKAHQKAYTIMASLLEKKVNLVVLIGSLYAHFRRLLMVLITKKTVDEFMVEFDIKEYPVKKAIQQAKKFTPKLLKNALELIQECDYLFKSGQMETSLVLDYIVLNLINL